MYIFFHMLGYVILSTCFNTIADLCMYVVCSILIDIVCMSAELNMFVLTYGPLSTCTEYEY